MRNLLHIRLQQRDAVDSEEDCQKKYNARCLFLNVAKNLCAEHPQGPFRLYCDDVRPSNIMIDIETFRVSGVIDWELVYAAPAEFTYVAPWWLLLQSPENWEGDLNQFLLHCTPRLRAFLEVLGDCENKLIERHVLTEPQRLSPRMKDSMETGLFWVCLAARYSSMCDEIYWTFSYLEGRIKLLNQEQQHDIDELGGLKLANALKSSMITILSIGYLSYDVYLLVNHNDRCHIYPSPREDWRI